MRYRNLVVVIAFMAWLLAGMCRAGSEADLFPLAIGTVWSYQFNTSFSLETSITKQGTVEYGVTDSVTTSDSVVWMLRRIRDVRSCSTLHFPPYDSYCNETVDTMDLVLVESLAGLHRISLPAEPWSWDGDIFAFLNAVPIYRYSPSETTFTSDIPWCQGVFIHLALKAGEGLASVELRFGYDTCSVDHAYHGIDHLLTGMVTTSVGPAWPDCQPEGYALAPNYPNPFNPSTMIRYTLPERSLLRLVIYDILGRRVATLVDGIQDVGEWTVQWDARDVPNGVYFCCFEAVSTTDAARSFRQVRKLIASK